MNQVANVNDLKPLSHMQVQVTCDAVYAEVHRQDALARGGKFGGTHVLVSGPDPLRLAVLVEEVGEVSRELCEGTIAGRDADRDALIRELVQVAACAVAWATALEMGS